MSDKVTYTKDETVYVVTNPDAPVASDAWFDEILIDPLTGQPELDDDNYVKVKRHVTRSGVDTSNFVTTNTYTQGMAAKANASEVNAALGAKANAASLDNYLLKTGGALTGGVASAVENSQTVSGSVTFNATSKTIYPVTATGDMVINLSGSAGAQVMILGLNLGNYLVTYASNIKWSGGEVPTLTENGTDALIFVTSDGATWTGTVINDIKAAS